MSRNPAENPWVKMITTMSPDAICQVLKEIPEETPLSKEVVVGNDTLLHLMLN